jgi:hypothetical protein
VAFGLRCLIDKYGLRRELNACKLPTGTMFVVDARPTIISVPSVSNIINKCVKNKYSERYSELQVVVARALWPARYMYIFLRVLSVINKVVGFTVSMHVSLCYLCGVVSANSLLVVTKFPFICKAVVCRRHPPSKK